MGRYASRYLPDDPVGGRFKHLDCTDPGLGKVEALAIITELSVARRLIERQRANEAPCSDVDEGEAEVARFLYRDVCEFTVGTNRDGMGLRHRRRGDYGLCRGIDEVDSVFSVNRDQQQTIIGRQRYAVRRLADSNRLHDFVGSGIDDVNRRRAIAAHVHGTTALRYRHAMRSRGDLNGRDYLGGIGFDHTHRVVFEISHVSLCRRDGVAWLYHLSTGCDCEDANPEQGMQPSKARRHLFIARYHFLGSS